VTSAPAFWKREVLNHLCKLTVSGAKKAQPIEKHRVCHPALRTASLFNMSGDVHIALATNDLRAICCRDSAASFSHTHTRAGR
jgi:hypothetical protein